MQKQKKQQTKVSSFAFLKTAFGKLDAVIMLFPPFILFGVLLILLGIRSALQRDISNLVLAPEPLVNYSLSLYPQFTEKTGDFQPNNIFPTLLTAESAVVMDNDSKVFLFEKNSSLPLSMASTTKIVTALVALSHFKPNDILTIKTDQVEGAVVGFIKGDQVRFLDVLYGMLLPSGNDAAFAIAQNYPGGQEAFVEAMNKRVKDLHLQNTHFSDPAGLTDEGDYTTARELAIVASEALKNPLFKKIVQTKEKTINTEKYQRAYVLTNLNRLLGAYGVTGIKTGFTPEAGGILATSKNENGHLLIITVMKSQDRFADTEKLLQLVSGNITYQSIHP